MRRRFARVLAACATLALCACDASSEGGAVLYDRGYSLETFATNADGITSPDGLLWDGDSLLIADEGGSAVRRLGPGGLATLADESSGLISPEDLAIGPDGAIYVSDDSARGVWAIAGGTARRVPGPGSAAEGIALARDGRLLVGEPDNGGIRAYRPGAAQAERFPAGAMTKPESMAFDAAGNLYVADNADDVLYRFDASSGRRTELLRREGFSPESIAMIGDSLWITDTDNGKLYRLGPDGNLETVALFAGTLNNLSGVAGDPKGNIYVAIQSDLAAKQGVIVVLRPRKATR